MLREEGSRCSLPSLPFHVRGAEGGWVGVESIFSSRARHSFHKYPVFQPALPMQKDAGLSKSWDKQWSTFHFPSTFSWAPSGRVNAEVINHKKAKKTPNIWRKIFFPNISVECSLWMLQAEVQLPSPAGKDAKTRLCPAVRMP